MLWVPVFCTIEYGSFDVSIDISWKEVKYQGKYHTHNVKVRQILKNLYFMLHETFIFQCCQKDEGHAKISFSPSLDLPIVKIDDQPT